jgi:hypothetical protein
METAMLAIPAETLHWLLSRGEGSTPGMTLRSDLRPRLTLAIIYRVEGGDWHWAIQPGVTGACGTGVTETVEHAKYIVCAVFGLRDIHIPEMP